MSEGQVIITGMENGTYIRTLEGWTRVNQETGYWVAKEEVDPSDVEVGQCLGVWTDSNGKTWYDRTYFVDDLNAALILAREWNQLAIWDNANQTEIPMNPNY